jgi:hypothetical protein
MSRTTSPSTRRRRFWIATGAIGVAGLAGLLVVANPGSTGSGGVDCPEEATNSVVLVGLSSSGRDARIIDERRGEVRHQLAVAADCGNDLIVRAWSTAGSVRTLWGVEDRLEIPGQTEAGRDRRINGAVDEAMTTVDERLQRAIHELPADGSDFLAWTDLAVDARYELGTDQPISVTVLDDGVQTTAPDLNQPLTIEDATRLASEHAPSADLHDTIVTIRGVGQIAGIPAPAGGEWVPALRVFAKTTCEATGATCTVLAAAGAAA